MKTSYLIRRLIGAALSLCGLPYAMAQLAFESVTPAASTNLPNVLAYRQPQTNFNPATASPEALRLYGYPPRPDPVREAAAFEVWVKAMSTPHTRIRPYLQQTNIGHGPARDLQTHVQPRASSEFNSQATGSVYTTLSNWSGYCLVDDNTRPFAHSSIFATYVIPEAQHAFGSSKGSWDFCYQWVGIDGAGSSSDVLQAGTEADAFPAGNNPETYYGAWYEWWPNNTITISNLPVKAGDVMFVEVWNDNATQGHAYLLDLSTQQSVSIAFNAPQNTRLVGNCMEWIVERPTWKGSLTTLTNYIACPFEFTHGSDYSTGYYPGMTGFSGTIYNVGMNDDFGKLISSCYLMGPESLWFTDTGSALSQANALSDSFNR